MEGQQEVMTGIWNFYHDLYIAEPCSSFSDCIRVIPNCISNSMNVSLTSPVSFNEVEKAVFDLGAHKSPGPDGLNGLFFQKNWETIKHDVFKAVQFFFPDGLLGNDVNFNMVALIPKISQYESITHLRPISCCTFIYKVIAKALCLDLNL